jgi:hypothetical protein
VGSVRELAGTAREITRLIEHALPDSDQLKAQQEASEETL